LSGKGRFVSRAPLVMDFDQATSTYTATGTVKDVARDTTWRMICETGALTDIPRTVEEIARVCGLAHADAKVPGASRRKIQDALRDRQEVGLMHEERRGQTVTLYRRLGTTV
jgi:hypothetical protein